MTTKAQKTANQKNALLSTGPKSKQGKSIASLNSLKHGLLTKKLVLKEENRKELLLLREQYYEALNPIGAIEALMVEKIINAAWRLQRLTKAETEALEENDYSYGSSRRLSQAFSGMRGECLSSLLRYETSIERALYKALHELQRLQAMRMGQSVLAPIAIDVSVVGTE